MLLKGANKIKSVRFRRWTRKTYAVFAIISIPVSQYTEAADLIPVFCINQRLEQFRLV